MYYLNIQIFLETIYVAFYHSTFTIRTATSISNSVDKICFSVPTLRIVFTPSIKTIRVRYFCEYYFLRKFHQYRRMSFLDVPSLVTFMVSQNRFSRKQNFVSDEFILQFRLIFARRVILFAVVLRFLLQFLPVISQLKVYLTDLQNYFFKKNHCYVNSYEEASRNLRNRNGLGRHKSPPLVVDKYYGNNFPKQQRVNRVRYYTSKEGSVVQRRFHEVERNCSAKGHFHDYLNEQ